MGTSPDAPQMLGTCTSSGGEGQVVGGYILPEDYNFLSGPNNNIGLIRVQKPFHISSDFQPATLPLGLAIDGQVGVLATDHSHATNLPQGKLTVYRTTVTNTSGSTFEVQSGLCHSPWYDNNGDEGEGFTMSGGGKHYLVGIVANAINDKCNIRTSDNRTLILNVFAYNDWIRSRTGILGPALLPRPYADILWRNTNGGLAIWFMKGGTSIGQSYPSYNANNGAPVSNDWKVVGSWKFLWWLSGKYFVASHRWNFGDLENELYWAYDWRFSALVTILQVELLETIGKLLG